MVYVQDTNVVSKSSIDLPGTASGISMYTLFYLV
jgi:hypothetical protein